MKSSQNCEPSIAPDGIEQIHVTLELMPVTELGSHLHDTMGRPSKELYSMAGLILLMEMMNWTKQEAVTEYCFNMADFGRTRLMGVAIKRFLAKVKQYDTDSYELLEETLRQRYAPSVHHLFGDTGKDKESRRLLRQQVAEDMLALVQRFADDPAHNNRDTYKAMKRIFYEQCEVQEDKVIVKAKPGGDIMQNPSDPDATRDGHKGAGYQVQISETCNPDNEVQLITSALPQTAVESDSEALEPVLDDLKESSLLPEQMLVDTSYCSDENVEKAANEYDVELVGPVPSGTVAEEKAYSLNIDDFVIDEKTEEVICCPAGHKPTSSVHDPETGRTHTVMPESACCGCDYGMECPVKKTRGGYTFCHTAKARRTAGRRREEATDVFRERYQRRSGIEGTNSGLKRRTGLGQLRVRGKPAVFRSILLKVTGWNILRASACAKMREIVYARAGVSLSCCDRYYLLVKLSGLGPLKQLKDNLSAISKPNPESTLLAWAA
jgi:hypothetical protein